MVRVRFATLNQFLILSIKEMLSYPRGIYYNEISEKRFLSNECNLILYSYKDNQSEILLWRRNIYLAEKIIKKIYFIYTYTNKYINLLQA